MAFVVIGGNGRKDKTNERYFIKDRDGVVEVSLSFISKHPDWYAYSGYTRVNGSICHTFDLIE